MYSLDVREIARRLYTIFESLRKVGTCMNVSHTSVARWLKDISRKKYKRSLPSKTDKIIEFIKVTIQQNPFISLSLLRLKVKECFGFSISKELIRIAIKKLGITKKKAKFFGQSSNHSERLRIFIEEREEYKNQGLPFVSLDETSFGRNGKDVYGYSKKGEMLTIRKQRPYIKTASALCVVSDESILSYSLKSGSFNTDSFYEFLEKLNLPEKTVFLLDNVSFHHSKKIKEFFEFKNWKLLYTPPYSPWFNPIEGIFSIVKRNFYKDYDISKSFECVHKHHLEAFFRKSLNIFNGP